MAKKTNEYTVKIDNFKENIKSQAEDLVLQTFPKKTLELHSLLESPKFSLKNLEKIKHEINIPIPEYPYVTPVQSKLISINHCKSIDDDNDNDDNETDEDGNKNKNTLGVDDSSTTTTTANGPSNSNRKRKYLVLTEDIDTTDNDDVGADEDGNLNKEKLMKWNCTNNSNNNIDSTGTSSSSTTSSIGGNNNNNGSRVLILPYGSVKCNKFIVELIELVKPLIRQLVDDTNILKMWVLFLIPRIEDGNNFGVSIQEETLAEIRTVEAEAAAYFDQMSRYFLSRARIITKIAKYPHVDDFRRNVSEIDEKEFISLRLIVAELRNHYASLHDIVTKNLEKIKTPRPQNQNTMY